MSRKRTPTPVPDFKLSENMSASVAQELRVRHSSKYDDIINRALELKVEQTFAVEFGDVTKDEHRMHVDKVGNAVVRCGKRFEKKFSIRMGTEGRVLVQRIE